MKKIYKPSWFKNDVVIVSTAKTCGINKDGLELFEVDEISGQRSNQINDELLKSVTSIINNESNEHVVELNYENVISSKVLVPQYFDLHSVKEIKDEFYENENYDLVTLGELIDNNTLSISEGHGSPSADQRIGDVPYIKVSDIRAGQVNINQTNLIPLELAKKYWKAENSNLKPYDLISPKRASKNIGEFAVLMPDQTNIVLTKEVMIIRSNSDLIDQFYLMWALSLKTVRKQWDRIILMQTNREDVGNRIREILIPIPLNKKTMEEKSQIFGEYYGLVEKARKQLQLKLEQDEFSHYQQTNNKFNE